VAAVVAAVELVGLAEVAALEVVVLVVGQPQLQGR